MAEKCDSVKRVFEEYKKTDTKFTGIKSRPSPVYNALRPGRTSRLDLNPYFGNLVDEAALGLTLHQQLFGAIERIKILSKEVSPKIHNSTYGE